jgi:hypothetical protein
MLIAGGILFILLGLLFQNVGLFILGLVFVGIGIALSLAWRSHLRGGAL